MDQTMTAWGFSGCAEGFFVEMEKMGLDVMFIDDSIPYQIVRSGVFEDSMNLVGRSWGSGF